jgi:hypothetical protein
MRTLEAIGIALSLSACAAPPPPAPPPAPKAKAVDEAAARQAVATALTSLAKRNFDVGECTPVEARVVSEAAARAGEPVGERCTMLVGRQPDQRWLVSVRAATTATPSKAGGSIALVTVSKGGEGVVKIEYAR